MIKSLRFKNFKGWKDTGKIDFSRITLFMGSNSSGKSSIGQFLMLLKQSCSSADRKTVLFLGDSTSVVELGGPIDMLYEHNIEDMLEFEYSWQLPEPLILANMTDDATQQKIVINEIEFSNQIAVHDKDIQTLEVEKMLYTLQKQDRTTFSVGMDRVQKASSARAYKTITQNYDIKRVPGRAWEMPSPYRFYGFPEEMISYHKNAYFTPQLNAAHENLFSHISYLGPLREKAERQYRWTGFIPDSVGQSGINTIRALLAAKTEKRKYNFKPKQQYSSLDTVVAKALKEMGLVEDFMIQRVADRQDYEVKVKTKGSHTFTDVPDVGFGISQVLPVLVQLYYAPANSIIIMEQPELHLHPKAQSALADIMIQAISARENNAPRNIQLIIETHSEHFLRRFQRRIAEDKLSNAYFSAYFANNDVSPTHLEPLELSSFGEIMNWPKNFFGDINGDIFAQTNAALTRQFPGE